MLAHNDSMDMNVVASSVRVHRQHRSLESLTTLCDSIMAVADTTAARYAVRFPSQKHQRNALLTVAIRSVAALDAMPSTTDVFTKLYPQMRQWLLNLPSVAGS